MDMILPDVKKQREFVVMKKLTDFDHMPDSALHNPDVHYIRGLVEVIGISQRKAADVLGINERTLRHYLDPKHSNTAPYAIQFALECMAVKMLGEINSKIVVNND